MNLFNLPQALASQNPDETTSEVASNTKEPQSASGLSIQPSTVAFQILNFLVLIIILNKILYKPLFKVLKEREKKIHDGVKNAEKAEGMLQESQLIREDMIINAKSESNNIIEKARKAADELKARILHIAKEDATKKIQTSEKLIEMREKEAFEKIKVSAVNLIVSAAERVIKEKIDKNKDRQLIKESIKSYSSSR